MIENINPLDYLIRCCEESLISGKNNISRVTILNAQYQLDKIRSQNNNMKVVAWARKNDRDDLYDIRTVQNPYLDPSIVVPLYSDGKTLHDNSAQ